MAREIFYAVKSIETATPLNDNFPGAVHTYIVGKEDFDLLAKGAGLWYDVNRLTSGFVRDFGYRRMCDVVRNYTYRHPGARSPYWSRSVSIVRLLICDDDTVRVIE